MTTVAQRKAQVAYNKAMRDALIAEVLKLDKEGLKGGQIAAKVGKSPMAVSSILIANGRRKKARGVRKPSSERARTHQRTCERCERVEMIRVDHAHTKYCKNCAHEVAREQRLGQPPPNKGSTEGQIQRTCKSCRKVFTCYRSSLKRRPNYKWESYCSRACYADAQRTPGSKWSDFDSSGRKRWHL